MRTSTISKYLSFISFFLIFFSASAQIRISSPYSRYGLGELQNTSSVYSSGMGGISFGLRNSTYINMNNPASYTSFDTNSFVFDLGLNSISTQLKTNVSTQGYTNLTSLGHILFGFPVTRWCGVSLGLVPFSKTGYKVVMSDTLTNIGRVNEEFIGKGGINRFYLGTAFKPFKNFSIGTNISYIFGTISKNRSVYLPEYTYSYNIRIKNDMEVSGIYMDFGLQYQINLKNNYALVLGSKFNLSMKLNAKRSILSERFTSSGEIESIKDTLLNINSEAGKIQMPFCIGGGFTFVKKNIWMVGADFNWQNWKKFKSYAVSDSINNSFTFSLGGEYVPAYNSLTSYWKKINYRMGFHFSRNYLDIHNAKINDFSVSVGLGFPVKRIKTMLNVSVEAGRKGTISNNLIQENYVRLILGISFREFWFFRPKID